MTHNPYLPFLDAPIDFPLFYNRLVSYKKHFCAHVLALTYPSDSYKVIFVFRTKTTQTCQLPAPTLPVRLLSSSA
ncbi:unnamed protein product, partial [Hymenolepis diminuta]